MDLKHKGRLWIKARANLSQKESQCVCDSGGGVQGTGTNRVVDMSVKILWSYLLNALILSVNHKKCLWGDRKKMNNIGDFGWKFIGGVDFTSSDIEEGNDGRNKSG